MIVMVVVILLNKLIWSSCNVFVAVLEAATPPPSSLCQTSDIVLYGVKGPRLSIFQSISSLAINLRESGT